MKSKFNKIIREIKGIHIIKFIKTGTEQSNPIKQEIVFKGKLKDQSLISKIKFILSLLFGIYQKPTIKKGSKIILKFKRDDNGELNGEYETQYLRKNNEDHIRYELIDEQTKKQLNKKERTIAYLIYQINEQGFDFLEYINLDLLKLRLKNRIREDRKYENFDEKVVIDDEIKIAHENLRTFSFDKNTQEQFIYSTNAYIEYLEKRKDVENRKQKNKISLKEIALLYFYERKSITRKNANNIAQKYGYRSGEKLFQNYTRFSSRQNRIAPETTHKKSINKLSLIENVILLIKNNPNAIKVALDEYNTLKAGIEIENQ